MRRWKVAISLAIVGAVAAPLILGTLNKMPVSEYWVPLTEKRRQEIESYLKETDYCKKLVEFNAQFECEYGDMKSLEEGGGWTIYNDLVKYSAINLAVAIAVFAGIFASAMVIPSIVSGATAIVLRYWRWLKT